MVADDVAFVELLAQQAGVALGLLADDEERGRHVLPAQHRQDAGRPGGVGAVVEGEGHETGARHVAHRPVRLLGGVLGGHEPDGVERPGGLRSDTPEGHADVGGGGHLGPGAAVGEGATPFGLHGIEGHVGPGLGGQRRRLGHRQVGRLPALALGRPGVAVRRHSHEQLRRGHRPEGGGQALADPGEAPHRPGLAGRVVLVVGHPHDPDPVAGQAGQVVGGGVVAVGVGEGGDGDQHPAPAQGVGQVGDERRVAVPHRGVEVLEVEDDAVPRGAGHGVRYGGDEPAPGLLVVDQGPDPAAVPVAAVVVGDDQEPLGAGQMGPDEPVGDGADLDRAGVGAERGAGDGQGGEPGHVAVDAGRGVVVVAGGEAEHLQSATGARGQPAGAAGRRYRPGRGGRAAVGLAGGGLGGGSLGGGLGGGGLAARGADIDDQRIGPAAVHGEGQRHQQRGDGGATAEHQDGVAPPLPGPVPQEPPRGHQCRHRHPGSDGNEPADKQSRHHPGRWEAQPARGRAKTHSRQTYRCVAAATARKSEDL